MTTALRFASEPGIAAALTAPRVVLFDWHATLVNTADALYHAMDELLPQLESLGLIDRLTPPEESRNEDDARLVAYVRAHRQLHPKVRAARKVSRTDLFEVLFADDEEAKHVAHEAYNTCYRRHFGEVQPYEGGERDMLLALRRLGVRTAVLTNREREFYQHELQILEGGSWTGLFDASVCGSDSPRRKPAPDPIFKALELLDAPADAHCWFIGDSSTDVVAARRAGVGSVLFNGAGWPHAWLAKVFPGNAAHPHVPDVIVDSFEEFRTLCEACLQKESSA